MKLLNIFDALLNRENFPLENWQLGGKKAKINIQSCQKVDKHSEAANFWWVVVCVLLITVYILGQ